MRCGVYHIKTTAGDIYAQTFTWNSEDGEPIDLSIYTDIKMQIKQTYDGEVLSEASISEGGITIGGDDNNKIYLSIEIPETPGNYLYDMEFTATGVRETKLRGKVFVNPQVTT